MGLYAKGICTDQVLYVNLGSVRWPEVPASFSTSERRLRDCRTHYLRFQGKNGLQELESLLCVYVKQAGLKTHGQLGSFLGNMPLSYRRSFLEDGEHREPHTQIPFPRIWESLPTDTQGTSLSFSRGRQRY